MNDDVMDYEVIEARSVKQLEDFVCNEIKHGWRPTGGLAVFMHESDEMLGQPEPRFLQALIKCPTGK